MAHSCTLNYFPVTGRGECCRLGFYLATMKFTDNQIPFEEWAYAKSEYKKLYPLQQVPTLTARGETITGQLPIMRFIGNEYHFYGDSNLQRTDVDQVLETVREIFDGLADIMFEKTTDGDTKRPSTNVGITTTKKAAYIKYFESQKHNFTFLVNLWKRNDTGDFFLGFKATIADVYYHPVHEYIIACLPNALDAYPELDICQRKIASITTVRKYLATRKHNMFM